MLKFCLAGEYPADVNKIGGGVLHVMFMLTEVFADRRDIDFHVVTPAKGLESDKVVEKPGVTIHYVSSHKHRLMPNLLTQGKRIASVLQDLKPDIVNSHHCVTTNAAIRAGCTVVHTVHGVAHKEIPYMHGRGRFSQILHADLERRAVAKADAVISVSQYGFDCYEPNIKGPRYLMSVLVEDIFWDIKPLDNCKSIVFAGGIGRRKNPMVLVKAMANVVDRHQDAKLYVCGNVVERAYMNDIENFIKSNNLQNAIQFLGVVDRYKLAELLGKSVALVLLSRQESSPGVICQAMAAGRIPIASPVGGVPELIDDGVTGFLVSPDDSDTLATRLIALFDDPDKAKQMGESAKEVALSRHDSHMVADSILEICKSVLNKSDSKILA